MIIRDIHQDQGYFRTVIVKCETCNRERETSWHNARSKSEHLCRSCSSKAMIKNHPESFAQCPTLMREKKIALARHRNRRIQSGYKQLYMPEHPYAVGGGKLRKSTYVYEHYFVMEQKLGRYILPHEIIHHINGNPGDNRLENLFLCSGRDKTESRQIHNACHHSAELLVYQLVQRGIVQFTEGQYVLNPKFADIFEV